jgi:hypothetical protein
MSMILTLSLALKHFYGYVPWDFLPIEPNMFVSFKNREIKVSSEKANRTFKYVFVSTYNVITFSSIQKYIFMS